MSILNYKSGKLHMENVPLEDVARACGTPVYCYSTQQIADNFHAFQSAMLKVMPADKFTICYACKANSNLAIIKLLHRLGAGMDVVSVGEMYRAFKMGVSAKKMVFSGVGKTGVELTRAIKNGLMLINVESESELNLISKISLKEGPKVNIAFRVNPNVDAKTHAKITTGLEDNKFGIDIRDAAELYRKAKAMPGIVPIGVAVHIGSQLTDLAPFEEAFRSVAGLVTTLRQQGHVITTVDLGGGIGITYKDETPPDLDAYANLIRDILLPLDVHVVLEPGRFIVGNAGVLLTRAVHIKKTRTRKFLIVDAAMNDLIRPALYDAHHPIMPCTIQPENKVHDTFTVVGPICETSDTFLEEEELPEYTQPDSLLAITVAGAYGAVMASNYNSRPMVPEALVSAAQFDQIRKTQKIEDLAALDTVPEWLA